MENNLTNEIQEISDTFTMLSAIDIQKMDLIDSLSLVAEQLRFSRAIRPIVEKYTSVEEARNKVEQNKKDSMVNFMNFVKNYKPE